MPDSVSAVVPVEGSPNKVMALIGRKICLVDRETGAQQLSLERIPLGA